MQKAALLALAVVACAPAPKPQPVTVPAVPAPPAPVAAAPPPPAAAVAEADREGDSPQTAVAVPKDAPEGGVLFENEWIYGRFGRFRRRGGGTGVLENRRYDIVNIELPDGTKHKVFFDITENWNAWRPPQ